MQRYEKSETGSGADLGMFSMFGRTGAPTKRGPHKRTVKFLQHSIIEIIIRKRYFCVARWCHKVSNQVLPGVLCAIIMLMRDRNKMSIMTTLSPGGIRILWRGPHFFLNRPCLD